MTPAEFRLGIDPMPDWFLDARAMHRITTHNIDGRWAGGPDFALIRTDSGTVRVNFGEVVRP